MAPPKRDSVHPITAHYSFIDLERMKGWVGLERNHFSVMCHWFCVAWTVRCQTYCCLPRHRHHRQTVVITSILIEMWSIVISMSVCVYVCNMSSVRSHVLINIRQKFTIFSINVTCSRGSVLLWRQCDMLCTRCGKKVAPKVFCRFLSNCLEVCRNFFTNLYTVMFDI